MISRFCEPLGTLCGTSTPTYSFLLVLLCHILTSAVTPLQRTLNPSPSVELTRGFQTASSSTEQVDGDCPYGSPRRQGRYIGLPNLHVCHLSESARVGAEAARRPRHQSDSRAEPTKLLRKIRSTPRHSDTVTPTLPTPNNRQLPSDRHPASLVPPPPNPAPSLFYPCCLVGWCDVHSRLRAQGNRNIFPELPALTETIGL